MAQNRIEQLRVFLEESPNDPFPKYALALELMGKENALADQYFSELLADHPNYLPTYYTAAHFYLEMEEFHKAKEIFESGIELSVDNQKTHAELKNAYQNFLIEYDD